MAQGFGVLLGEMASPAQVSYPPDNETGKLLK
jgi:hypothetical protein